MDTKINVAEAAPAEEPKAQGAAASFALSDFEEFKTITVTGNFRGSWREVPVRDEAGNPRTDEAGKPLKRNQFKLRRTVRFQGRTVLQTAWLNEADANEHGLKEGVQYNLTLECSENLTPARSNGTPGYLDEYAFASATIISVNSK